MRHDNDWDVIVAGAGPAGSATATLCAMQGRRVLLIEKERFPRFHIGESLMPATWWSFQRLGLVEKMKRSPFPRKHSVQFFLGSGQATSPFYFSSIDPSEASVTWQVERSQFDRMLIEHAAEAGVTVRQGEALAEVVFEGERATGVASRCEDGSRRLETARVVVDATGQDSVLARAFSLRVWDPMLRNAAVFTRFRGAVRDPGIDEGATLVINTAGEKAWFWYIPLHDDLVSVGVVGPIDHILKGRSGDPQRIFDEELARCPALIPRLKPGVQEGPMRVLRDFSYVSSRISGEGWLLVGDAFGFLDPIYSSGLLLGLKGAEMASESIATAFASGDFSGRVLGAHGPRFIAGMEAIRRLVYAYYTPAFHFKHFLQRYPERRDDITNILTGNVYRAPYDGLMDALATMLDTPGYRPLGLDPVPA